nr:MAG: CHAT domain-containing protein [Leptolyngbya sp. IPPAS B-1204]
MGNRCRPIFKSLRFAVLVLFGFLLFSLIPAPQSVQWLSEWPAPVGQAGLAQTAPNPVLQQSTQQSAQQLVQQGVERYQAGDIASALPLWQAALSIYQDSQQLEQAAIVLENLARAHQQLGQVSEAVTYWQQAVDIYRQLGHLQQTGRMLTEQAQALSRLGQHRQAIALLCGDGTTCSVNSAVALAQQNNDGIGTAAALGSLGEAYRLIGDYNRAIQVLQQALAVAETLEQPTYRIATLNSLGNAHVNLAQLSYRRANSAEQRGDRQEATQRRQIGQQADRQALSYFQQGLILAESDSGRSSSPASSQLRVLLSSVAPFYRTDQPDAAKAAVQQALQLWQTLPDSQTKAYAAIDLAHLLQPSTVTQRVSPLQCLAEAAAPEAAQLLQQAIEISQRIGDRRAESFGLGELGHLYECQTNYTQALNLTQKARWAADQDLQAKDSLYLWEWQTGRILQAQKQQEAAITAYERAIATLETIRGDLLSANRDLQYDFRDTIDPLYRELVALRLEQGGTQSAPTSPQQQANVSQALETLDSLKLAELQNYFGDNCIVVAPTQATVANLGADQNTAVFNSVILTDRTAIIVSLPQGKQQIHWIEFEQDTINNIINEYRRELERDYKVFDPRYAETLYDWIVAPFADTLEQAQISTLVFIQDGILRSVPMAALYNAKTQQFLVETYAIATTPSLTLTDAKPLERKNLKALALGLTQPTTIDTRSFSSLDNVAGEISEVERQLPGSKPLLDQEFTRERIKQELEQEAYPVVHIATHGEFGTEPEDTFLVTGNAQKLTITELDQLLRAAKYRDRIELLALTACQTATGDDRAALGLAGVAIQAGAKSALASLWFADDATTAKIAAQFYGYLKNSTDSRAAALQKAQIEVIRAGGTTTHPAYWAPFILIGNWL